MDTMHLCKKNWEQVSSRALAASWNPLVHEGLEPLPENIEANAEVQALIQSDEVIKSWMTIDKDDEGYGIIEVKDIEKSILLEDFEDSQEDCDDMNESCEIIEPAH